MFKRVFLIVTDSLGVGQAKDADKFNDIGANTLGHILEGDNYHLPVFEKLGLTDIVKNDGKYKFGYHGKLEPANKAKDTLNGHYEMMGIVYDKPFMTYPDGFPIYLISEIQRVTGRQVIGNCAMSGTEIIKELGEMHMKTGAIIVYTSADSVLQVAAHEDIIPLEELYSICEKISKLVFNEEYKVGRIIARPFIGKTKDTFTRTSNRHDYAVKPFGRTVLEEMKENDYSVISVGKIKDIFDGVGITEAYRSKSNHDGMDITIRICKEFDFTGLCFVILVDFDALYGHRRNRVGYANCVEEFDQQLDEFINSMRADDLLIICADHGNDPTHSGTDHTREHVPLLVYNALTKATDLKVRSTFADIGATISDNFALKMPDIGTSFLKELKK